MAVRTDYEGMLLSSIIRENDLISTARSLVGPEAFENPNYKSIYQKIISLYGEKGMVDNVIISDVLTDLQDEVALKKAFSHAGILSPEKLETYATEIIRRSQIGRINELADIIKKETSTISEITDSKLQEIVSRFHGKLFEISGNSTFVRPKKEDVIKEMKQDMLLYQGKELWGYNTGWETLNRVTRGISRQQLWVVGAYTSVGKSWFSLVMASNLAKLGKKVLYLSTEMSEKRLYWRLASVLSEMPEYKLIFANLNLVESSRRSATLQQIQGFPIEIRSGIGDINDAMFEIRKAKAQGYCDVVIIDFLQNLATGKDEYQELTTAVRKLQNLAMREDVAIVLASQNNRESQKAESESLYGFKGSGAIETAADVAIVLSRLKVNERTDQYLICDVLKNRNGLTGKMLFTVDFETGRMQDEGFYDKSALLPNPLKPVVIL